MICFSCGTFYEQSTNISGEADSVRDAFIVYSAGNFAIHSASSNQTTTAASRDAQPVLGTSLYFSRQTIALTAILADSLSVLLFCVAWKYLVNAEKQEAEFVDASSVTVEKFSIEFSKVPPDITQGDLLEWLQGSVGVRVEKCHLVPNYNQLMQIVRSRSEILGAIDHVNQRMAALSKTTHFKLHSSIRIIEGADIESDVSRARNRWLDMLSATMVARHESGQRQLMPSKQNMEQMLQPILAQLHNTLGARIRDEIKLRRSSKKLHFAQHVVRQLHQSPQLLGPSKEVKQTDNITHWDTDVKLYSVSVSSSVGSSPKVAASPQNGQPKQQGPADGQQARTPTSRTFNKRTSIAEAERILSKRTQHQAMPPGIKVQLAELWNEREGLLNQCADLQTQLMTEYVSGELVAAFVIFRTQADRDDALERIGRALTKAPCQRRTRQIQFLGGPPLHAATAPKPSTVIWENLGFDQYEKIVRRGLSRAASGLLILITGLALYFALSVDVDFPFFTYIATFIVIAVNTVLENVIRSLVQTEKHRNTDAIEDGISRQLFIRLFLNTGLLLVAINVNSASAVSSGVSAESYSDLTPAWFKDVGQPLVVAMIYDIVLPFLPLFVEGALALCRKKLFLLGLMQRPSQRELNALLEGSDFAMAENYARITNVVFVCFMFSSGLPVLNFVALLTFLTSFWGDKVWFCYFVKTPPSYSLKVGRAASESLLYASLLHTITAIWLYSGTSFHLNADKIEDLPGYSTWHTGIDRFAQWPLVPHFVLLLLQLYWVLRQTLRLPPCFKLAQMCACLRVAETAGLEEVLHSRGKRGAAKAKELRRLKQLHSKSYQDCLNEGLLDGDFPDYAVQRNQAYAAAFTLLEEDPKGRAADARAIGIVPQGEVFNDIGFNNRIVKFNPSAAPCKSFQAKAGNALRVAMKRVSAVVASTPKKSARKGQIVPMVHNGEWHMRSLSSRRIGVAGDAAPEVKVVNITDTESGSSSGSETA